MKKTTNKPPQNAPKPEPSEEFKAQDTIRQRAYQLWEAAGRPNNCDLAHWLEAERQIKDQERAQ